jgi:hypothetical protein
MLQRPQIPEILKFPDRNFWTSGSEVHLERAAKYVVA